MTGSRDGRRAGLMPWAAAALVLLAGCAAPNTETGPPQVPSSAPAGGSSSAPAVPSPPGSAPADTEGAGAGGPNLPSVLPASAPVSLRIPATGTESDLLQLGLRGDGTLEVPPEGPGSPAGWYTDSPAPGARGPAVLLGHVNATGGGPGVFADLRRLAPGDRIEITREDGTTAVFQMDRGEQYGKDSFPTLEVYGNTAGSELRLITCDGYDPATGTFEDNYVVFASLAD